MLRCVILALSIAFLAACRAEPPLILPTEAALPTPLPPLLTPFQPATGTLSDAEPSATWRFDVPMADLASLRTTGPALELTLRDAAGTVIGAGAVIENAVVPAGAHTVTVRLLDGQSGAFDYEIGLVLASGIPTVTPSPTPLPFAGLGERVDELASGRSLSGELRTGGPDHVYTFEGQAGAFARVEMSRASGLVDPVLRLYGPDGRVLAVDDNGGGGRAALLRSIPLPVDGLYGVVASGEGLEGGYQISLLLAGDPFPATPQSAMAPTPTRAPIVLTPTIASAQPGQRLTPYEPVRDTIDRPGALRRHAFFAAQGDTFTVGVTPDEGIGLQLEILGPDGVILDRSNALGPDGELLLTLADAPSTGAYVALVTAAGDTTGGYTIGYGLGSTREDVRFGETRANLPYQTALLRRGVGHLWFMTLFTGDMISATATSDDPTLDLVLEVVSPEGEVLIRDDNTLDGRNPNVRSFRASRTGLYALRVRPTQSDMIGAYVLQWNYITAAPSPTPALATVDIINADDITQPDPPVTYPFQGRAGQEVLISVDAVPGSQLDPIAALIGPDGAIVAENDDSGGTLNPRINITLPVDGTYTVRVNGYLSTGEFELRVQEVYRP